MPLLPQMFEAIQHVPKYSIKPFHVYIENILSSCITAWFSNPNARTQTAAESSDIARFIMRITYPPSNGFIGSTASRRKLMSSKVHTTWATLSSHCYHREKHLPINHNALEPHCTIQTTILSQHRSTMAFICTTNFDLHDYGLVT